MTGILLYRVNHSIYFDQARKDLQIQADAAAEQIPTLVENDYYFHAEEKKSLYAKLKALSFALGKYEDIADAKDFLDEYSLDSGIEGIAIQDRDGKLLYGAEKYIYKDLTAEQIRMALDKHTFEKAAEKSLFSDAEMAVLLSSEEDEKDIEGYSWGAKERWLISIRDTVSEDGRNMECFFDWRNGLKRIRIFESGFVHAVDESDRALYDSTDKVKEIEIAGKEYLAVRLDIDDALMLAMVPVEEIRRDVRESTGILMTFEGAVHVGDFVYYHDSYKEKYGTVVSIGVRVTRLKWFSETTFVRNDDFRNYVNLPAWEDNRVATELMIDPRESLAHVESILETELPLIEQKICEEDQVNLHGLFYRGVEKISENGITLSFIFFTDGINYSWMRRSVNRELKLMCERHGIRIAMNQVMVHSAEEC